MSIKSGWDQEVIDIKKLYSSTLLQWPDNKGGEMKLKGYLTEKGVNLLERRFVPALEKLGKVCHLYMTHHNIIFLHNILSHGVRSVADFATSSLFDELHISSRNRDRIAFSVDLSLLHRALRSSALLLLRSRGAAGPHPRRRLQLKLVKKLPRNSAKQAPFLTLETGGHNSAVVHDVPISRPLSREEILEIEAALEAAREVPRTMVHVPDAALLAGFAEKMRPVGEELMVCVSRNGGIDFRVSTTLITIGADLSGLVVVGEPDPGRVSVTVGLKNFCKSLVFQAAKPDCSFYGIGPERGCLVVVFQFFVPGTRETDKSISLHCRVPAIYPGSN